MEIGHHAKGGIGDTSDLERLQESIRNPKTQFPDGAREGKWKTGSN